MAWRYTEEGERVRVSLRSGRILPLPPYQRRDGIVPDEWIGEQGLGEPGCGGGGHGGWPLPRQGLSVVPRLGLHADGPKDTAVKDVLDKTYQPSLRPFEEEIMEAMGIVETRRAKKSYWY